MHLTPQVAVYHCFIVFITNSSKSIAVISHNSCSLMFTLLLSHKLKRCISDFFNVSGHYCVILWYTIHGSRLKWFRPECIVICYLSVSMLHSWSRIGPFALFTLRYASVETIRCKSQIFVACIGEATTSYTVKDPSTAILLRRVKKRNSSLTLLT